MAYSGPAYNEIGVIYQSCNFIYLGKTDPKDQADHIMHGEKMSEWKVRRIYTLPQKGCRGHRTDGYAESYSVQKGPGLI